MRGRRPGKTGGVFAGIHRGFFRAEYDTDDHGSFAAVERLMSDRLLECLYMGTSSFLLIHAARNVDYLAMDSVRYYTVGKVTTLCQASKTSCINPCPRPSWWSTMSWPSRICARRFFSRQAFRSSLPTAVQRPSKCARSTKDLSICC